MKRWLIDLNGFRSLQLWGSHILLAITTLGPGKLVAVPLRVTHRSGPGRYSRFRGENNEEYSSDGTIAYMMRHSYQRRRRPPP